VRRILSFTIFFLLPFGEQLPDSLSKTPRLCKQKTDKRKNATRPAETAPWKWYNTGNRHETADLALKGDE
jgi:hypothetical protein